MEITNYYYYLAYNNNSKSDIIPTIMNTDLLLAYMDKAPEWVLRYTAQLLILLLLFLYLAFNCFSKVHVVQIVSQ